jgi:hypothetical protein
VKKYKKIRFLYLKADIAEIKGPKMVRKRLKIYMAEGLTGNLIVYDTSLPSESLAVTLKTMVDKDSGFPFMSLSEETISRKGGIS